jgi:flavin reductase (DIM6/NTAB) family NADH-FMN oxidoreductase RutF
VDGVYRASTVTGYMVASLDPYLLFVSLERDSQMEHWIRESQVFGLSVLSYHQQFLADRFAGMAPLAPARFQGIEHDIGVTGVPILSRAIGWAECRVVSEQTMGDHTCFLGDVVASGRGEGFGDDPLVYFRGKYVRLR